MANPVELAVKFFPALALVLLFLGQTLALLLEPRRVVALVRNALASVEFENPTGYVVEEVAVVRHTQDRALVLFEVLLQPIDGFRIEVVGRLVQQQDVRLLQQQATQGHPTALSPTQLRNLLVVWRAAKGVHGDAQLGVELPRVEGIDFVLDGRLAVHELLHLVGIIEDLLVHELHVDLLVLLQHVHNFLRAFLHDFSHRLGFIQLRLLREITDGVPIGPHHVTLECLVQACNDFHHRGFTRTVVSDDANFGPVEKREVDVLEDVLAGGGRLVDLHHAEDDFLVVRHEGRDSG